jgi:hypothetical protein
MDSTAYNGNRVLSSPGFARPRQHVVGDCRMEALLTVKRTAPGPRAGVELRIVEDEHAFALFLPTGGPAEAVLRDNGRAVARRKIEPLRPGQRVSVTLENYDDLVVGRLRGRTLFEHPYDGNPTPKRRRQKVELGAAQADVVFHRVRVYRDIYYLDENPSPGRARRYALGADSYFVLGDNTAASSDSRHWRSPEVPRENLMGEAFAIFWPLHDVKPLSLSPRQNPARGGNP